MNQASFLLPILRWSLPWRLHLLINLPGTRPSLFIVLLSSFSLHAVNLRSPDILMKLQLQAQIHATFSDPARQLLQIYQAPGRRDQDRFRSLLQIMFFDNLNHEVPIGTIAYYDFDFIKLRPKQIEIGPVISFRFSRSRTLYIENDFRPLIHIGNRHIAA